MPRLTSRNPSYRHHKKSGQAVVTLSGKDHYLGPYGSKTSRAEYDRLVGIWLANGRLPHSGRNSPDLTVTEVIVAYWHHAQSYYVKNGKPTGEQSNIRNALRPLTRLFGHTAVARFHAGLATATDSETGGNL